ncbi:MAG: hypothetical protein AUI36_24065 [Cyanobacteria bacterium 13_1_40CM_2_61_4]|nr:MAG: hypothetical protein AUI36_24065 [Cyanobacteria bacterium 13_1_40CM_2_61_4]
MQRTRHEEAEHRAHDALAIMGGGSLPGRTGLGAAPNQGLELTASSVRAVRRASGREAGGNTLGGQGPHEPLERST